MATIQKFEDLRIWQDAKDICIWYWTVVKTTDLEKDFKLKSQADASSGSVMDNIAEGFERNGNREFIQFLAIAKGSCGEFRSQLYRIHNRGYIDLETFNLKLKELENLNKGISSFINYLKKSNTKGWKFKEEQVPYGSSDAEDAQL